MRFKKFITEKYLEASRAPLYHWTADYMLKGILKTGKLGYAADGGYDPLKGITKFSNGWVSFTRDKNYRIGGKRNSNIRLSFDPIKLQQKGYKIRPYVDRSVVRNATDETSRLPQDEARFEAEEKVKGPIDLKDGLISIEADPSIIKQYEELIEKFKKTKEEHLKIADEVKNGKKFTIQFYKEQQAPNYHETEWVKNAEKELEKDPNWKPKWFTPERYEKFAVGDQRQIDEYSEFLKRLTPLK